MSFDQLSLTGPELTFVIFPIALGMMPFTNFWTVLFYFMMLSLGIDTMFAFCEYISVSIEELTY